MNYHYMQIIINCRIIQIAVYPIIMSMIYTSYSLGKNYKIKTKIKCIIK